MQEFLHPDLYEEWLDIEEEKMSVQVEQVLEEQPNTGVLK